MLEVNLIRGARASKRMTQQDVAKLLGVSRKWYGEFENGERKIDNIKLSELCRVLDLQISQIFH